MAAGGGAARRQGKPRALACVTLPAASRSPQSASLESFCRFAATSCSDLRQSRQQAEDEKLNRHRIRCTPHIFAIVQ